MARATSYTLIVVAVVASIVHYEETCICFTLNKHRHTNAVVIFSEKEQRFQIESIMFEV